MKTINEALDTAEQALEKSLQETVTIKTLRHIFNHSILSVVNDMYESQDDTVLGISSAGYRYLTVTMGINVEGVIVDGESLEDEDDDLAVVDRMSNVDFFNNYKSDAEYDYSVEHHVARLALEIPELPLSSLRFGNFYDHCVLYFFKKALEENITSWNLFDDAKVLELQEFIKVYNVGSNCEPVPADANVVYEAKSFQDLFVYICEEFPSDRPDHEMLYFMEALMCWMCPCMSFHYRSSELLDIYIHDDSERFRTLSEYLVDVFFSDAFADIVINASERTDCKLISLLERTLGYGD
ncbi:hypothetical protein EJ576_21925 [Pseudomonas sp. C 49-2]|uniref:hypothetical protein n=1 Tax=Pseudomonas sp. C 49-2 TaxID=2496849 RepID=UPI000F817528|nr:hypothetical protein [Pseudomonas sp. C 49-2]RTX96387.1 hypothetical protein EJ576_21925 [Pseudomonas sp. C 49-2]